jgi:hypothetical protein
MNGVKQWVTTNDPLIIEWLNSDEGFTWSKEYHDQKLLVLEMKNDAEAIDWHFWAYVSYEISY